MKEPRQITVIVYERSEEAIQADREHNERIERMIEESARDYEENERERTRDNLHSY